MRKGKANLACNLNAVGTKLQVEKPQRLLVNSASLPPTRSSVSTSFGGTRESHWSEFSSRSNFSSPMPSRCFSPSSLSFETSTESVERNATADSKGRRKGQRSPGRSLSRPQHPSGPLPKLSRRPSRVATLPPMEDIEFPLDVVGASFSLAPHVRRWSRSGMGTAQSSVGSTSSAWQEPDPKDLGDMHKQRKGVPLMTWLQALWSVLSFPSCEEMGVDVDMSDLLVQGRSTMNRARLQPMSNSRRARLDMAFVEHLDRIARERDLPLEHLSQDLQIFRLKLHSRQARRRLHDIFGAKRRPAPPPPEFAKVVSIPAVEVPKVKETVPSFPDAYIPRTPKAVVAVEVPQVLPTDPSVAPTAPVTPISRKPTPQKPAPQEVDEPVAPVRTPSVQSEEEEVVEEVTRPQPKTPTHPSTPTVQPKAKAKQELPEVKPPTPQVKEEVVVEPRGLFRIKDSLLDPDGALLFPQRRPTKEKTKSKETVLHEDEWWFQEESEKPRSSQGESRPVSRRRFNLAEQFREALALAWQRALQSLEDQRSFPEQREEKDEDEEDEQSSDKEFMETWTSLFSDSDSTESLSLSESAKRLQRRRYRKRLLRRTRGNQARERTTRCWTNRMEVCRRLLQSVDVLAAKGTISPC